MHFSANSFLTGIHDRRHFFHETVAAINAFYNRPHANALFYIAYEDALLVSFRSQSWIAKIDQATGNIIYTMEESTGISKGVTANFFNLKAGTWMNSQAVQYPLDESAMTAVQIWKAVAAKYTFSIGDLDELDGGNVLICAGGPDGFGSGSDSPPHVLEVSNATPSKAP